MVLKFLALIYLFAQPDFKFVDSFRDKNRSDFTPKPCKHDSLLINLCEGDRKIYHIKITNPHQKGYRWKIQLKPNFEWLSLASNSGFLNPGEKTEIKLTVDAQQPGIYQSSVVVRNSNLLASDQLINLKVMVTSYPPPHSAFIISRSRLKKFFPDSFNILISALAKFITNYEVRGIILDLDSSPVVKKAYRIWDHLDNWRSPSITNKVVQAIDNYLESALQPYPGIKFIILVGDDQIIPYYRVIDRSTRGFQEINYFKHKPNHTLGVAVDSNLILTNDIYADREEEFNYSYFSMPYEFVVSRLIKSPSQIINQLRYFTEGGSEIPIREIMVSSGDYSDSTAIFDLKDSADSILQIYGQGFGFGHINGRLIQDEEIFPNYDLNIFKSIFLGRKFDLYSINNHAYHTGFFMPQHNMLKVQRIAEESPMMIRTIIHTVGCHTGMTNFDSLSMTWDFPSTFAQKGVGAYIANMAYSIGSGLGIGYSERLQVYIAKHLASGICIGEALRNAKHEYWATRDPNVPNPSDDLKVILPISLFGLPFYRCVNYDYRFEVVRAGKTFKTQIR